MIKVKNILTKLKNKICYKIARKKIIKNDSRLKRLEINHELQLEATKDHITHLTTIDADKYENFILRQSKQIQKRHIIINKQINLRTKIEKLLNEQEICLNNTDFELFYKLDSNINQLWLEIFEIMEITPMEEENQINTKND